MKADKLTYYFDDKYAHIKNNDRSSKTLKNTQLTSSYMIVKINPKSI